MASTAISLQYTDATRPSLPLASSPRALLPSRTHQGIRSSFKGGSLLVIRRISNGREHACKAVPELIRCEQSTKGSNGLDVWLGRLAMVGFATAITIEISTGKGLLENIGFTSPLPTVALAVTGLVGVLTAFFIFQSASRN